MSDSISDGIVWRGFEETIFLNPSNDITQAILLISFLGLMYVIEKYDLFKLKRSEENFEKDEGIQD